MGYFGDTLSDLGRAVGDAIDRALEFRPLAINRPAAPSLPAWARSAPVALARLGILWDQASAPARLGLAGSFGLALTIATALISAALLRRPAPPEAPPAHRQALDAVNQRVLDRKAESERQSARAGPPDRAARSPAPPQRLRHP